MRIAKKNRIGGFNLKEALVLIGILAALGAVLVPYYSHAKQRALRIRCISHLKQIGLSFRQWSLDNNDRFPMQLSVTTNGVKERVEQGHVFPVFQVMSNELNTPKLLWCPRDRGRNPAPDFTQGLGDTNISYFVGLDADASHPQGVLTGDDNLLINGQPRPRGVVSLWTNTPVAWSSERHYGGGNAGYADGSVQQVSNARLITTLHNTGPATNRLVFP